MSEQEKQQSAWKLEDTSELPVMPGVGEAREHWLGKEVWCLTPWKQWRRGKVRSIGNDGFVAVMVYQKGTLGIGVGCSLADIPHVLKLVSE
jgi:hypothetical protein